MTEITEEQAQTIANAGFGQVVSDRFSIRMRAPDGTLASSFFGQPVWVKLPYRGQQTHVDRIRLITLKKGVWQDSGIQPRWVHVADGDTGQRILTSDSLYEGEAGYVLFRVDEPFTALAITGMPD